MATGIQQLPPKQRAVVHLFYVEELSVEEIATALRIPPGTVKSRLHHAREALKRHLDVGPNVDARQEIESRRRRTS